MGEVGYKTLAIDIETFSDVDLIKCGVYAYADSPAFEILLFAYSIAVAVGSTYNPFIYFRF